MALLISARAARDLDDIWYYIASEAGSTDRADAQIDALTRSFRLLGQFPFLGRELPDLRKGLRSFPVGSYVVLYRVAADTAVILHVFPGMRDIAALIG